MTVVYKCTTHQVEVTISPGKREIKIPMQQRGDCCLPTMKEPQEGEQDTCRIEKVSGG
ncbi:MAG: hypothetical protein ACUVRF_09145 [Desulfotomaculales bacterium]